MYKRVLGVSLLCFMSLSLHAENNSTIKHHVDNNSSVKTSKKDMNITSGTKAERVKKEVEAQMKREEKYAKEMVFYQGDDYDLKSHEVDNKALESVPVIKPDYDFSMDDVYRDDI